MKTPYSRIEELETKTYLSIDELAEYCEVHRDTVTKRIDLLKPARMGDGGTRLYYKDPAVSLIWSGIPDEKSGPQLLEPKDIHLIAREYLLARMNEVMPEILSLTTVTRMKSVVGRFLKDTIEEHNSLLSSLWARRNEQVKKRYPNRF